MTPPTLTPAEQIRRFIERHPGEWLVCPPREDGVRYPSAHAVLFLRGLPTVSVTIGHGGAVVHTRYGDSYGAELPVLIKPPPGADLLTKIVCRVADSVQLNGSTTDTLPPWLADPVRRILRARAGELLTLAGSSPADVVSAAETLDEALCKRPVVEVTGVLRTLMSLGMSCRWATGADEAADDYVGFVSRRLDVVAGERDGLRAAIVQALADLDAYDRSDGQQALAPLTARACLRRVLGVT